MGHLKVLHIGKYFPPYAGGMETYLRDLMTSQVRHGLGVAALAHKSDIGLRSQDEIYPSGHYALPVTRAAVWAKLLFAPVSPAFPWLLNRLIKQHRPDILHLHMPNLSVFWALFLPSARRIPWVIQWQADVVRSEHSLGLRAFYIFYHLFEKAILRRCNTIIVSTPPYLASSRMLQHFVDKCRVIPLGLDSRSQQVPVSRQSESDSDTPLRVLAVGRLTYYKGFDYLIKAVSQCRNIQLKIVGEGDMDKNLKKLASELSMDNRVTFCGYLTEDQLEEEFISCDCLCLPAIERTESFGMVLLEAMSHGKATVVSDVPGSGMSWVVDDGVTGLHVPPKSIEGLKHALNELDMNRDKTRQMGVMGREKFDNMFQIDKTAGEVSVVYHQVLGKAAQSSLRII